MPIERLDEIALRQAARKKAEDNCPKPGLFFDALSFTARDISDQSILGPRQRSFHDNQVVIFYNPYHLHVLHCFAIHTHVACTGAVWQASAWGGTHTGRTCWRSETGTV